MKALIIDHDDVTARLLSSRLQALGYSVFHEPDKHAAVDLIARERVDLVLLDPAPLATSRPTVLNIRRVTSHYPYVLLLARDVSAQQAIATGTNDVLEKPVDPEALKAKSANAQRLIALTADLGDDAQDFPSAGGVISRSAFNQLYLAALDRADRYAERSFILVFTIENAGSKEDAAKLSQRLVALRRQSDIIGQIGHNRYALLLQRPAFEREPQDASVRFADQLGSHADLVSVNGARLKIKVELVETPTGALLANYRI